MCVFFVRFLGWLPRASTHAGYVSRVPCHVRRGLVQEAWPSEWSPRSPRRTARRPRSNRETEKIQVQNSSTEAQVQALRLVLQVQRYATQSNNGEALLAVQGHYSSIVIQH